MDRYRIAEYVMVLLVRDDFTVVQHANDCGICVHHTRPCGLEMMRSSSSVAEVCAAMNIDVVRTQDKKKNSNAWYTIPWKCVGR